MKMLVFSDSHSSLRFMYRCVEVCKPDAVVHLGDYFNDGQDLAEEYPTIPFYAVPGNCDRGRGWITEPETKLQIIGGVRFMLTHGHLHNVKTNRHQLLLEARKMDAQVVLYGHTHVADCHQEADGIWVMNPGACGSTGGSVGLIEICDGSITECKILHLSDLEEML